MARAAQAAAEATAEAIVKNYFEFAFRVVVLGALLRSRR